MGPASLGEVMQLLVDLEGGIEAALPGRYVDVENRLLGLFQLINERPQSGVDFVLVQLPRRLPRGAIRVAEREHLVGPDHLDALVAGDDAAAGGENLVDRPGV